MRDNNWIGGGMMSGINTQPSLPAALAAGVVSIGEAVVLVQDSDGGRVFLRGELVYTWSAEDVPLRRLAAVQLVANRAARVGDVAAAFGVDNGTLWGRGQQLSATGVGGLVSDKCVAFGPKRSSRRLGGPPHPDKHPLNADTCCAVWRTSVPEASGSQGRQGSLTEWGCATARRWKASITSLGISTWSMKSAPLGP